MIGTEQADILRAALDDYLDDVDPDDIDTDDLAWIMVRALRLAGQARPAGA